MKRWFLAFCVFVLFLGLVGCNAAEPLTEDQLRDQLVSSLIDEVDETVDQVLTDEQEQELREAAEVAEAAAKAALKELADLSGEGLSDSAGSTVEYGVTSILNELTSGVLTLTDELSFFLEETVDIQGLQDLFNEFGLDLILQGEDDTHYGVLYQYSVTLPDDYTLEDLTVLAERLYQAGFAQYAYFGASYADIPVGTEELSPLWLSIMTLLS